MSAIDDFGDNQHGSEDGHEGHDQHHEDGHLQEPTEELPGEGHSDEDEPAPAPKQKSSKAILAVPVVVLLAMFGFMAYKLSTPQNPVGQQQAGPTFNGPDAPANKPAERPVDFTMNLSPQGAQATAQNTQNSGPTSPAVNPQSAPVAGPVPGAAPPMVGNGTPQPANPANPAQPGQAPTNGVPVSPMPQAMAPAQTVQQPVAVGPAPVAPVLAQNMAPAPAASISAPAAVAPAPAASAPQIAPTVPTQLDAKTVELQSKQADLTQLDTKIQLDEAQLKKLTEDLNWSRQQRAGLQKDVAKLSAKPVSPTSVTKPSPAPVAKADKPASTAPSPKAVQKKVVEPKVNLAAQGRTDYAVYAIIDGRAWLASLKDKVNYPVAVGERLPDGSEILSMDEGKFEVRTSKGVVHDEAHVKSALAGTDK